MDDGTVARLGEDEFFVTVTTGNTAALERWITWWNADWGLDVRVLNLTGAYAAVNLAGPRLARRDAFAHRRRRLGRGRAVPVGDHDGRRRRSGARAADRVRRRARVRDPRPVDVRRARVGRGHDRRRDARHPAVRPGGAADPPPGEAAHPGRAGHGRRVRPVRGRSRLDGQGGQGRLPRQARARGPRRRGAGGAARRLHVFGDVGAARGRERGPRRACGWVASRRPGTAPRPGSSSAWPGCPRAGRATGPRSRSSSARTARTPPSRCGRSTTPTARGSGRERTRPPLAARAFARGSRCRAGPGGGVGARRALRRRGVRTHDPAREGRGGRRDGARQDRRPGFARRMRSRRRATSSPRGSPTTGRSC